MFILPHLWEIALAAEMHAPRAGSIAPELFGFVRSYGASMNKVVDKERKILEISSGFYDALLGGASWSQALEPLMPLFHGHSFHLLFHSGETNVVTTLGVGGNTPEHLVEAYTNYYVKIDPRRQHIGQQDVGAVVPCHTVFDERFVSKSEMYQDYVIPVGHRYTLCAKPAAFGGETALFAFMRTEDAGKYSAEEVELFRPLVYQLGRALQLQQRMQGLQSRTFAQQQALDALTFGVLVADRDGRILNINAQAERLLQSACGLHVADGKLGFDSPANQGRLAQLLQSAADKGIGGGMSLRGSNQSTLDIWAAPARDGLNMAQQPLVVLVLTDPNQPAPLDVVLRQAFGLTPAEARLAQALAAGASINDYAEQHHLSVATVRTQVRAIYHKTGVTRQTELIRMLARGAGLLHR